MFTLEDILLLGTVGLILVVPLLLLACLYIADIIKKLWGEGSDE